jgi:hypothetical protein
MRLLTFSGQTADTPGGGLQEHTMEERPAAGGRQMHCRTHRPGTLRVNRQNDRQTYDSWYLAVEGHLVLVATEAGNVLLHPLKRQQLVLDAWTSLLRVDDRND